MQFFALARSSGFMLYISDHMGCRKLRAANVQYFGLASSNVQAHWKSSDYGWGFWILVLPENDVDVLRVVEYVPERTMVVCWLAGYCHIIFQT